MIRKSKWISGVESGQAASHAGRLAIAARLRTVAYYMPLAAERSESDIEYVHQLRVACRRAVASIDFFAAMLPRRRAEEVRQQLKQLRRAAGEARDLDVLIMRLAAGSELAASPHRETLLEFLRKRRVNEQRPIVKAVEKAQRRRFPRRMRKLARRVHCRPAEERASEPSFGQAAPCWLAPTVREFCLASDAALVDDVATLHALRIAGKRLRYAMELAAGGMPAEFRGELYPAIEQLQARLGDVCDHAVALERYGVWRCKWRKRRLAPAIDELCRAESSRLAASLAEFRDWWTPAQRRRIAQSLKSSVAGCGDDGTTGAD